MNGKYLLDTNIIVALFKNDEKVLLQLSASVEVYVPAISIGELYYGAKHSSHVDRNMEQVREFAANSTVLPCNLTTGEYYGNIKHKLKAKGRPLPENDIWIAATASQYGLILVTRDRHFKEIEDLSSVEW